MNVCFSFSIFHSSLLFEFFKTKISDHVSWSISSNCTIMLLKPHILIKVLGCWSQFQNGPHILGFKSPRWASSCSHKLSLKGLKAAVKDHHKQAFCHFGIKVGIVVHITIGWLLMQIRKVKKMQKCAHCFNWLRVYSLIFAATCLWMTLFLIRYLVDQKVCLLCRKFIY